MRKPLGVSTTLVVGGVFVSLLLGGAVGLAAGESLISNGGFEGEKAGSWRLEGARIIEGEAHQGRRCARIEGTGMGYQGILYSPVRGIRVDAAGKYRLTFWVKAHREGGFLKARVRQRKGEEHLGQLGYYEFLLPETTEWTEFGRDILATLDADNILLDFYFINARGTACIDDVALEKTGSIEPVESDKLTEELRKKLEAEGCKTAQESEYLVAGKDGLRRFHRLIKGKKYLTTGEWEREAFAGSEVDKLSYRMGHFPIGPALYGYSLYARAEQLGVNKWEYIAKILDDLKSYHMNTIWFGNTGVDPADIETMVTLCEQKGLSAVFQMSGAYYRCTEPEYRNDPAKRRKHYEEVNVPFVRAVIPKYRDRKGVFAWSVKEETRAEYAQELAAYYKLVGELDPTHPILLCHNNLEAAEKMAEPYPTIMGFDRYYYRASLSGGGYLRTPALAISLLEQEVPPFYQASLRYRIPFSYVIQGVASYVTGADFSKEGTQGANMMRRGWVQETPAKTWRGWLRYYPPKHCMSLQVWAAVALGAKGIFCYYYGTPGWGKIKPDLRTEGELGLAWDARGPRPPQWEEFGEAAKDILYFAPVILKMNKRVVNVASSDSAHVLVSTFQEEDSHRKYLVVVNKRTGAWAKDSPETLKAEDEMTVNDEGQLVGYTPAPPLEFVLKVKGDQCLHDLRTDRRLEGHAVAGERQYPMVLPPGGGNILLLGER